mmetsp:Transcript_6791/g.15203  ORF Transcript_6791/g.15203 Transcript_6791/m.15203 type:complete len:402 (-) Transcript_6791:42-1247(-)
MIGTQSASTDQIQLNQNGEEAGPSMHPGNGNGRSMPTKSMDTENGNNEREMRKSPVDETIFKRPCLERFYLRVGFGRKLLTPYKCLPVFNILILLALFGFFIFNAQNIIKDYLESQKNPPSSIKVVDGEEILFPVILICNSIYNVNMSYVGEGPLYSGANCSDVQGCDSYFGWVNITSTGGNSDRQHCLLVDASSLPGVHSLDNLDLTNGTRFETLQISLDIDDLASTPDDPFVGVEIYVYSKITYEDIGPVLVPETSTETVVNQQALLALADGGNIAGVLQYSAFKLSLVKTEVANEALSPFHAYTLNTASAPLNPKFLKTDSMIVLEFAFSSSRVTTISFAPSSFSSFFGSLGGWIGVCSDGWGVLTLVFFFEKLFLRTTRARQQRWFVGPQERLDGEL